MILLNMDLMGRDHLPRKNISKAEAIKLVNSGIVVKNDTSEGYITIKRKLKGIYETKVYTNGEDKPEILIGNFGSLLKTMNQFDGFYIDETK